MKDVLIGMWLANSIFLFFLLAHLVVHVLEHGWFTPIG